MQEILPGLWHWSTQHPNIGMRVSSHAVTDAGLALDPMLPEGGADRLAALGVGTIALSCRHHRRAVPELQAALGARVLVPAPGLGDFEDDDAVTVSGYEDGDRLGRGVHAHVLGAIAPDDFVVHVDVDHGALLFGDGVVNMDGIGYVSDDLMDDPPAVKARTAQRVAELLDLRFDALLFAHGDPIPSGGKRALREWLATQ